MKIKKWQVYKAQYDIEVVSIVYFTAPYVGVYKRVLPYGEQFGIVDISSEDSQASCLPIYINKFEETFVPKAEILASDSFSKEYGEILLKKRYKGYFFIIPFDTLNRCCKNVGNSEVIDPLPFPELGFFLHLPKLLKQGMPEGLIKHTI